MRTDSFQSARQKVDRAKRHIDELQSVLAAFLQSNFCRLWVDSDPQTGRSVLRYETTPQPPEIPLIIGDAIHNLHVPLDHIASDIARRAGRDGNRVHFPKDETRDGLDRSPHMRRITELAPSLRTVILDEIRPYKAGNYPLWALGKLDNIDKHKLVIPIFSVVRLNGISAIDGAGNFIHNANVDIEPGGRINLGESYRTFKIIDYGTPSFAVMFPEDSHFSGKQVISTLLKLTQLIENIIITLETHYFKSRSHDPPM